ncbi:alpha-L-fucosidase, partial [Prevotellamassilia timonensis]|uniref:alpha-L-fucosidase n=1 Tax=Prevotellamassilia timonensis TaxID=1852370 RepID=UPI0040268117
TYTGNEWGYGNEDENKFAPTAAPNPEQWLTAVKAAGMKGGIAVVKHHDGFCLWPTATTTHNVTSSSNAYAKATNIPRDFAAAAKKLGMKYGFYVSPWDRNNEHYGDDTYVKDVFLRQCAELAAYGTDQFEMWFDGANGGNGYYGGKNGTRNIDRSTYYDVPNLRDTVHKVCPDCVLWGVGGESRWIGNEEGWAGETNWSPEEYLYAPEKNGMYGNMDGWYWQPGESDAKMTTGGWFWHSGEGQLGAERLFQMYLETVGRNATLILNCPPDKSGSLPAATVERLKEMGKMLTERLQGTNYAKEATVTANETRSAGTGRNFNAENVCNGDSATYWATNDGVNKGTITFAWDEAKPIRYVVLQEHIQLGQRVKAFSIETSNDGTNWTKRGGKIATTTIGYKRIIPLNGSTSNSYEANPQKVKYLRVNILDSRACPTIENIELR